MSERATSERIKRRGLHHPLTPDFMLLRLNAIQKAHSMDEVGINMEHNARLRDSWGPGTAQGPLQFGPELQALKHSPRAHRYPEGQPTRAQTCIPILKKSYQPRYNKYNGRQSISSQRWHTQAHQEREWVRWKCHRGAPGSWAHHIIQNVPLKTSACLPKISVVCVATKQTGIRLLTVSWLEERDVIQSKTVRERQDGRK